MIIPFHDDFVEFPRIWCDCDFCITSYAFARYSILIQRCEDYDFSIGISVWTKLIRNNTAVEYLFNGETYDFNYQFQHRLPKSIKLYPVNRKK